MDGFAHSLDTIAAEMGTDCHETDSLVRKLNLRERLAETRWLQRTPPSFRAAIIQAVRMRRVEKNQWLYGVEDEAGGPIAVLTGALAFDLPVGFGPQFAEWPIQPGHWIGVGAPIMGNNRQANLRAIVQSDVAELSAPALKRIIETEPEAWRYLAINVVQNSLVSISVASALMLRGSRSRVAATLLILTRTGFADENLLYPILLPQGEVARLCAVSRPAFSSLLSTFDAQGLTRTGYRSIEVLDDVGLAKVVEMD